MLWMGFSGSPMGGGHSPASRCGGVEAWQPSQGAGGCCPPNLAAVTPPPPRACVTPGSRPASSKPLLPWDQGATKLSKKCRLQGRAEPGALGGISLHSCLLHNRPGPYLPQQCCKDPPTFQAKEYCEGGGLRSGAPQPLGTRPWPQRALCKPLCGQLLSQPSSWGPLPP